MDKQSANAKAFEEYVKSLGENDQKTKVSELERKMYADWLDKVVFSFLGSAFVVYPTLHFSGKK